MAVYIPNVGESGAFTAIAPFSLISGRQYECISVRQYAELEQGRIDVFATIYQPVGLTQADFDADLKDCPILIGLRSGLGEISYVPAKYLNQSPVLSGVAYQDVVVAMSLGPLPTLLPLEDFVEHLKDFVTRELGVVCEISVGRRPQTQHYTQLQHDALVAARTAARGEDLLNDGSYAALRYQNQILQKKVLAMSAILQGKTTFILDGNEVTVNQALSVID